jgi:hypothetical protein
MKAAAFVLVVPLTGCASIWGFDDLTAGDAAASLDAPVRETGVTDSGSDVHSTEAATDAAIEGGGADGASDCPGSFLLCDGFESDSIDPMKWDQQSCTSMTSMDIGTTAHRGSYSLHVHVSAISDSSYADCRLQTSQVSIFSSTPMYFRAWVYLTNTLGTTLITALQSTSGGSGNMGVDATGRFTVGVANSGNDYSSTSTNAAPLSPNNWTCIELEIDTDYATYPNGMLAAWDSNTSSTADPQLAGTAKLQPLVAAKFGLTLNGPSPAADLFIDDIAISNTYVPCGQ